MSGNRRRTRPRAEAKRSWLFRTESTGLQAGASAARTPAPPPSWRLGGTAAEKGFVCEQLRACCLCRRSPRRAHHALGRRPRSVKAEGVLAGSSAGGGAVTGGLAPHTGTEAGGPAVPPRDGCGHCSSPPLDSPGLGQAGHTRLGPAPLSQLLPRPGTSPTPQVSGLSRRPRTNPVTAWGTHVCLPHCRSRPWGSR